LPWFDPAYQTTPMSIDLALNTAVSFATTTTWQAYAGETTMSYFSQMAGLAAQNFLAGAAGLAVGIAFIRGLARQHTKKLGNFWVDLTRAILWVLLPLSILGGIILVWQGVPLNFKPYTQVTTVEGVRKSSPRVPSPRWRRSKTSAPMAAASSTNGAHPYENPTPLTNLVEMLMIAVLPASLTYTFGRMVEKQKQGWLVFWVMTLLFTAGLVFGAWPEQSGNPALTAPGVDTRASEFQPGGNMEGKEVRLGIHGSVLAAIPPPMAQPILARCTTATPLWADGAAREYAAWRYHLRWIRNGAL
jgi:K+-transporting ATPase ATPase A chain